ncbi:hypothetical protein VNO80_25815 [Phaseolus coccineus]|uniref:Uncharacterized protein n=1 Tax=Phaseolus coccineus TaxID=3886 RepID=A0AAN9QP22_PHACN
MSQSRDTEMKKKKRKWCVGPQHSGRIKEERETAVAATLHPTATFARVLRVRFCRTPFAFTYSLTPRATYTLIT